MEAKLLNRKERMQEIYDLRVLAHENSPNKSFINRTIFPSGYSDNIDTLNETYHWIVEHDNKIIASQRIAIVREIELLDKEFHSIEALSETPFAYWGRIVVHPDFRKTNAMRLLERAGKKFILENPWINFSMCCAVPEKVKALEILGFRKAGMINFHWGANYRSNLYALILKNDKQ
jgi:hypothetical protein